jgi:hypothetical protein
MEMQQVHKVVTVVLVAVVVEANLVAVRHLVKDLQVVVLLLQVMVLAVVEQVLLVRVEAVAVSQQVVLD